MHTLVRHSDIQNWVNRHSGHPAVSNVPDEFGALRARLALNFPKREPVSATPSLDDGISPCSWVAWLAELDRQNLALRITDGQKPGFKFIDRKNLD